MFSNQISSGMPPILFLNIKRLHSLESTNVSSQKKQKQSTSSRSPREAGECIHVIKCNGKKDTGWK